MHGRTGCRVQVSGARLTPAGPPPAAGQQAPSLSRGAGGRCKGQDPPPARPGPGQLQDNNTTRPWPGQRAGARGQTHPRGHPQAQASMQASMQAPSLSRGQWAGARGKTHPHPQHPQVKASCRTNTQRRRLFFDPVVWEGWVTMVRSTGARAHPSALPKKEDEEVCGGGSNACVCVCIHTRTRTRTRTWAGAAHSHSQGRGKGQGQLIPNNNNNNNNNTHTHYLASR